MLKNWKDKILSFAAGALIACTGFAVAGLLNNGEGSMSENVSIMQNWFSDSDELGWVSTGIVSAKAEELNADEPCLTIVSNNVEYGSELFLQYAVPKTVDGIAVKMLYWVKEQTEYTYEAHQAQSETLAKLRDNGPSDVTDKVSEYSQCYVFKFPMAPKEATRYIYARAYYEKANEDGSTEYVYGNLLKYSILDYAYNIIARDTSATRVNLVKQLLNYAGAAQKHLSSNPSKLATDTYYYVGFAKGVTATIVETGEHIRKEGAYAPTEMVTIQAPEVDENGKPFVYWKDQKGNNYGNALTPMLEISLSEISNNIILEPVYENAFKFEARTKYADGSVKNYKVTGYTGTGVSVVFPTEYEGKPVIEIDSNVFTDKEGLIKSVVVPEGIGYISKSAFNGCKVLETVEISSSVTSIGDYAFSNCTSLKNISVDKNNTKFKDIDGNLYSADGTKLIQYATDKEGDVFRIPDGVTTISTQAIRANNLKTLYIPKTVMTIESKAVTSCPKSMVIYYQDSWTYDLSDTSSWNARPHTLIPLTDEEWNNLF